jgi:arginine decarboxylase
MARRDRYVDLIEQSFYFPTEEFTVINNELFFHGVPLMKIIKEYGTPLKLSYLPKISHNIQDAKRYFRNAMQKANYRGDYTYCYCTKASHFEFVLKEALKNDVHIETSSAFDIQIVRNLYKQKLIDKKTYVLCNGYKRELYTKYVSELVNDGFENVIPILDNIKEIDEYDKLMNKNCNVGIRFASDEEPKFEFYTSRLGVRQNDIIRLYKEKIEQNPKFTLKMLHFFINTGIKDTAYYWGELTDFLNTYCELRKVCPTIDSIDIGGGLPIKTSLEFKYNYQFMIEQVIETVKEVCTENGVPEPNIFSEFGSYTVGESGAVLYSLLDQKLQNDKEVWYMIDGSFITNLPDMWGINQKFILLAVNHWDKKYKKVHLGGLTCDSQDYYYTDEHSADIYLPVLDEKDPKKQYIGFFHTGAYQESLGGYGGIQHCLIPAPKHVLIDRDEDGEVVTRLFAKEQDSDGMLKTLGYTK